MPAGRDPRKTPTAVPLSTAAPLSKQTVIAQDARIAVRASSRAHGGAETGDMPGGRDWRLHKHADYQRVYQSSRKQFSALMTYFAAVQPADYAGAGPRIGITAGKVMGKAVERNRIKRRMRAAILGNLDVLAGNIDVVLHPKRSVLSADWTALDSEVRRVFTKIQQTTTGAPSKTLEPQS